MKIEKSRTSRHAYCWVILPSWVSKIGLSVNGRNCCWALLLTGCMVLTSNLVPAQPLNFAWAKQIGAVGSQIPNALQVDSRQQTYLSGIFNGTCDMDPGPGASNLVCTGWDDTFLAKYDGYGNYRWSKQWDTWGACPQILGIAVDSSFNLYLTGHFTANCDFDPSPLSNTTLAGSGIRDIFVLKLDSSGNFQWARGMGGADFDVGNAIEVDDLGNSYVTGYFTGTVDFNPGAGVFNLSSSSSGSSFLLKLDPSGNFVWAKKLGGAGQTWGYGIGLDTVGNVVSTGHFSGTADFDPGAGTYSLTASGATDVYVSKLSAAGAFIWAKRMGSTGSGSARDLVIDHASNVLVTGQFSGAIDFDPGTNVYLLSATSSSGDAFTLKLDFAGNLVWADRFGGSSATLGYKIAVDQAGNSYSTGLFYGGADFDPGPGTHSLPGFGGTDIFCVSLDASGNLIHPYHYGSALTDDHADVAVSVKGNVYNAGLFQSAIDLDPSGGIYALSSMGGNDIYLQKLSSCQPSHVYLSDTACNSYVYKGYLYTESQVILNSLESSLGCDSIVSMSLSIGGSDSTLTVSTCDSFFLNGQTYTSSGTFTQSLTDHLGCDSLLTLNLALSHSADSVLAITACDSLTLNGQTFTLPGSYTQMLTTNAGCDSMLTIDLSLNSTTYESLFDHGCNGYELNGQVYTLSGLYTQILMNASGCDSVLTLNLILDHADFTVTQIGNVLTSAQPNATYQWIDCSNANAAIPGANSQSFSPGATGSYSVIVSNGYCYDTSSCTMVNIVGVQNPGYGMLSAFPNPANDRIEIFFGRVITEGEIVLRNALGQVVLSFPVRSSDGVSLEMPEVMGMYFLEFQTEGERQELKVLRQ